MTKPQPPSSAHTHTPDDEKGLFHRVMVWAEQLQTLPNLAVILAFAVDALISGAVWLAEGGLSAALLGGGSVLITAWLSWEMLKALPRAGRSWGHDKPSALALGAVYAIAASALGLLALPVWTAALVNAVIALLAYYATWIEPFNLRVTRQSLRTNALEAGKTLRLLHLSDTHVERISPRERDLNRKIAALAPDVIVFSGDFVNISYNKDEQAKQAVREVIGAWRAPLGVFCVPGTPEVEPLQRVLAFVDGLDNLDLLTNRWVTVESDAGRLHILGLITTHDLDTDRAALDRAVSNMPSDGFKLLLVHAPDVAPEAAQAGFDLYLCGHTHGGQIRLPLIGALRTASAYGNRFAMGRVQVGKMVEYTSRGIGMEGLGAPRARFLCPPEIILWEITGE